MTEEGPEYTTGVARRRCVRVLHPQILLTGPRIPGSRKNYWNYCGPRPRQEEVHVDWLQEDAAGVRNLCLSALMPHTLSPRCTSRAAWGYRSGVVQDQDPHPPTPSQGKTRRGRLGSGSESGYPPCASVSHSGGWGQGWGGLVAALLLLQDV